jgi:uroporphyrinogen-III synthase
MADCLRDYTIALTEGRQIEDLAQMLQKEGATVLRCPMVRIVDTPNPAPVFAWLQDLRAGRFSYVILMTGEGLRRLLGFAERKGIREAVVGALRKTRIITRGPKPVRALAEVGLAPAAGLNAAPTTEGLIATLQHEPLGGRTLGVQLHPDANPALVQFLESVNALARTVMPYVYASAADEGEVLALIERLAGRTVDLVVFTSSPQVDRLYEVATTHDVRPALEQGMTRTLVAAIGPIVARNLVQRGVRVDICPEQGFVMKNLVQHIKRAVAAKPRQ